MKTRPDRILLVDGPAHPHDEVRAAIEGGLPDAEILESSDERTFSQALEAGDVDLVVTLPCLRWARAADVLHRVQVVCPEVPVLLFADHANEDLASEALRNGFDDLIPGDSSGLDRLPDSMRRALGRAREKAHATRTTSALESVLHRLNVGFFRLNAQGNLLKANRTLLNLLGIESMEQAHSFNLLEHFARADAARRFEEGLRRDGRIPFTEVFLRRADGSAIQVCLAECLGTTSIGETVLDGILIETSNCLVDTPPVAVAARLHVAVHSLRLMMFVLDRFGHIVWLHGPELEHLGIDVSEWQGVLFARLCPTEDGVAEDVRRVLAGEEVTRTREVAGRRYEVRMAPLLGARAVAPEVAVIAFPVTEASPGKETSRRTVASAERILDASPFAMCLLDESGTLRACNPIAAALFGWKTDQVVGHPFPLSSPAEMWAAFSAVGAAPPCTYHWSERVRRRGGAVVEVELFGTPLARAEGEENGVLVAAVPSILDLPQLAGPARASTAPREVRQMPSWTIPLC